MHGQRLRTICTDNDIPGLNARVHGGRIHLDRSHVDSHRKIVMRTDIFGDVQPVDAQTGFTAAVGQLLDHFPELVCRHRCQAVGPVIGYIAAVNDAHGPSVHIQQDPGSGRAAVNIGRDPLVTGVRQVQQFCACHCPVADRSGTAGGTADGDDRPSRHFLRRFRRQRGCLDAFPCLLRKIVLGYSDHRIACHGVRSDDFRGVFTLVMKCDPERPLLHQGIGRAEDQDPGIRLGNDQARKSLLTVLLGLSPPVGVL